MRIIMEMPDKETMKLAVHYLFALVTLIMLVSGLGITYYQTVQALTFGLLTKELSFQLHIAFVIPFVLLLALHIWLALDVRKKKDRKK
jgi:thiosulfate reductase cytochrome b subunit